MNSWTRTWTFGWAHRHRHEPEPVRGNSDRWRRPRQQYKKRVRRILTRAASGRPPLMAGDSRSTQPSVPSSQASELPVPNEAINAGTDRAAAGVPQSAVRPACPWCTGLANQRGALGRRSPHHGRSNRSARQAAGRVRAHHRRASISRAAGFFATSNTRSPATWTSMSSPSFRSSAAPTDAGRRTAKLLPHFETCMRFATRDTFLQLHITRGKRYCSLIQEPLQDVAGEDESSIGYHSRTPKTRPDNPQSVCLLDPETQQPTLLLMP